MHIELRVRTVCELSINEKFYLQPKIVSMLDPDGVVVSKMHCRVLVIAAHYKCRSDFEHLYSM